MIAVQTRQLLYRYPVKRGGEFINALEGVDLSVNSGEFFGFLGPNGSGKTTLFRILSTLASPTGGEASVFGMDIIRQMDKVRRLIGVVFQQPSLDGKLTVEENLVHHGHLYNIKGKALRKTIEVQLEKFGVLERRSEMVENLSGGLKRRVELAKGLMHNPRLLILDEPSSGLDPGARRDFMNILRTLNEKDSVTILMTTHLSEEAEKCGRLAIMDSGRIVLTGKPSELKSEIGGDVITIVTPSPEELMEKIRTHFSGDPVLVNDAIRVEIQRGHEFIPRLVEKFPGMVTSVTLGKPTLEDLFMRHTGRSF